MKATKGTQPQYTQGTSNLQHPMGRSNRKMWSMTQTSHRSNRRPIPPSSQTEQDSLQQAFTRAIEIMARLRGPGGCPWDREQTFDSIRRYTLEETYEVLDAIEHKDWPGLKDELGDLFLQVLFYAEMAREAGYFTLQDVMDSLSEKLIRRHPHVFANREGVETSAQVVANWEEIKKSERAESVNPKETSLLDAVPRALPALMEAGKLGSKAATIGFDWESAEPVFDKLQEELNELREAMAKGHRDQQEEELGDVLFTVVNLARKLGVQSEFALRGSNAKFRRRFAAMERSDTMAAPLAQLAPEALEELWNGVKAREGKDPAGEQPR